MLVQAAKRLIECKRSGWENPENCVGCPLNTKIRVYFSTSKEDRFGKIFWEIEACELMSRLNERLKKAK